MKPNKYFIGLTGSIATGKSAASHYLKTLGYFVVDADLIAREVVNFPQVKSQIKQFFGQEIYLSGHLNREHLASMIFHDNSLRETLNHIVHPVIYDRMKQVAEKCKDTIIFFDIPLLIETQEEAKQYGLVFDEIWMIYVPCELQVQRLMQRDGIDMKYAKEKISSQMDVETKRQYCDIVIDNSTTLEELYQKLEKEVKRVERKIS